MRQVIVTLSAIFILLSLLSSPTSAEGTYDVTIDMNVPQLEIGTESIIDTTLSSSVFPPISGELDYFGLKDAEVLGISDTSSVSSTNPSIEFTVSRDITTTVIQIPLVDVTGVNQMGAFLQYNILQDQTNLLSGDLHVEVFRKMVADGYILLAFGTAQTSTTELSLSSGITYTIDFTDGSGSLDFTFPGADTTTELIDDGTPTGTSVPLILYQGSIFGSKSISNGNGDFTFTPTQTFEQVLAYYSDEFGSYEAAYSLQYVSFNIPSNYQMNFADITVTTGQTTLLTAQLLDNSVGMPSETLTFQLQESTFYRNLGSDTSDGSGQASVAFTADLDPGTYTLRVFADIGSDTPEASATLTVQRPQAQYVSTNAMGYYGGATGTTSSVQVSTYIQSMQGAAISDVSIDIFKGTTLLDSSTTDGSGYVEFNFEEDLAIGSYSNYYRLEASHSLYLVDDKNLTLTIIKGVPQITLNTPDYNLSYDDPFTIIGNVTDQSGDQISLNMDVQIYNGTWQTIHTFTTTGIFSETLPSDYTGQYSYRIRNVITSKYSIGSTSFTATIDPVTASLSTDQSSYQIEYQGSKQITITLTSTISVEADLTISLQDTQETMNYNYLISGTTTGKSFTFIFTPDLVYSSLPYWDWYMLIESNTEAYDISSISVPFRIISSTMEASLNQAQYTVLESSSLTFDVRTDFGLDVVDGTAMDLTIGADTVSSSVIDGDITFTYTFPSAGSVSITISYSVPTAFPYFDYSKSFAVDIQKGILDLGINNYIANQGDTITLSGDLTDHVGNSVDESILIEIYQDGTWQLVDTSSTSIGSLSYDYLIGQSVGRGDHQLRFTISESANYEQMRKTITLSVIKTNTELVVTHPTIISYNSASEDRLVSIDLQTVFGVKLDNRNIILTRDGVPTALTTDGNGHVDYTLPNLLSPDTYNIQISFNGEADYTSATYNFGLTVEGTPTSIVWNAQPQDTYYGEFMDLSLRVQDQTMTYLSNMDVKVLVNGAQVALGTTNSTGHIEFNLQMLFSNENLNVEIQVLTRDGWEGTTEQFSIVQHKRILNADVGLQDGTNTTVFGEDLDLSLLTYSDSDSSLGGVSITIYLYNPDTGTKTLVGTYTSDSSGDLLRTLNLPIQSVAEDYSLWIDLSKSYYQSSSKIVAFEIVPADLVITTSNTPSTLLNPSTLTLQVSGPQTQGLQVDISIVDAYHNFQASGTIEADGSVSFQFTPKCTCTVVVGYTISDPNGNYYTVNDNFQFVVDKSTPEIVAEQIDIDTVPYLNVSLQINGFPVDGVIFWESNTISEQKSVNGFLLVQLDGSSQVTITVVEDSQLLPTSENVDIINENLSISIETAEFRANLDNTLDVRLITPYELYNHEVYLYLVEGGTETLLGMELTDNSTVSFDITTQFSEGRIQLKIVYPAQSFFVETSIVSDMDVNKQDFSVSMSYDQFVTGNLVNISFTIDLPITYPPGLDLVVYLDGVEMDRAVLQNNIDLSFMVTQQIGSYTLRISIAETPTTSGYNQNTQIDVLQETQISVIKTDYYYGDTNPVIIRLYDASTGVGISNQDLIVYKCGIFCSDSSQFLGSVRTNATGYAVFNIPKNFEPNSYDLYVVYDYNDNSFASSDYEFSAQIIPEILDVDLNINDYGVTHNITVSISITDESGIVSVPGEVTVTLGGVTQIYDYSGQPIELIYTQMVGDYALYVSYSPDSQFYQSANSNDQLGWTTFSTVDLTYSESAGSLEHYPFNFTSGVTPLTGITVDLYIDGQFVKTMMLHDGQISDRINLAPGQYQMEWRMYNELYMDQQWSSSYSFTVTKGEIDFSATSQPTRYGNGIEVSISDEVDNATYLIEINTGDDIIELESESKQFTIDEDLLVGNYSISITRAHNWLESTEITYEVSVLPVEATLSVTPGSNLLEFTITPIVDVSLVNFTITVTNDTHSLTYTLTELQFNHTLAPGTYELSYELHGVHQGSERLRITIPEVEPVSPQESGDDGEPVPSGAALSGLFVLGSIAIGAGRRYMKKKRQAP